jgi:hypothetical protein
VHVVDEFFGHFGGFLARFPEVREGKNAKIVMFAQKHVSISRHAGSHGGGKIRNNIFDQSEIYSDVICPARVENTDPINHPVRIVIFGY